MEFVAFKPGDIIQDYCKPFVKVLYQTEKGIRCDQCFKKNKSHSSTLSVINVPLLQCCSACKLVYYCSPKCQKLDWKDGHKVECSLNYFKQESTMFNSSTIDFKHRIIKLFSKLKQHPDSATMKYQLYDGNTRTFSDLMSHFDKVEKHPQFIKYCSDIATNLDVETDYILKLSGIFKTNAFCIWDEEKLERIGAGLYVQTSVFDHSCKPTAFFLMRESSIQIRCIGNIMSGDKPYISYILSHKDKTSRRDLLQRQYNFYCECERCIVEENDKVDYERIQQLLESQSNFDKGTTDWELVLKTHKELMKFFRQMYNEYDERITNQLFWVFTMLHEANGNKATKTFNELFSILSTEVEDHLEKTYGPDHPYFINFEEIHSTLTNKSGCDGSGES